MIKPPTFEFGTSVYPTGQKIVGITESHYHSLLLENSNLEKRLKDAQEILNAYCAGMEAQKIEIKKLKEKLGIKDE